MPWRHRYGRSMPIAEYIVAQEYEQKLAELMRFSWQGVIIITQHTLKEWCIIVPLEVRFCLSLALSSLLHYIYSLCCLSGIKCIPILLSKRRDYRREGRGITKLPISLPSRLLWSHLALPSVYCYLRVFIVYSDGPQVRPKSENQAWLHTGKPEFRKIPGR